MFEIRIVTENDVEQLQAISVETFSDTFGAQNQPDDLAEYLANAYSQQQLRLELAQVDSWFYFLWVDAELAGYLKLNINQAQSEQATKNSLEIERIYLRKAYQKRGLGKVLLEYAQQEAKNQSKSVIWLGVWEHNDNARAFYQKMGFVAFDQHEFVLGQDVQRDILMQRQL
ncbi:GNAT family N-acetyltransferase [Weissella diestrammenae]|uniref:GNAT family N-acetyltransferase n=1 Tax=Weissella diestrammenae TaxID=1162633 RepID=A0A7G9T3S4_9LACO|nr:GNAT family N-acetyltransferase [Weissella diestrammenae]MCM0582731.1 GNAT family N-acetyltransferase [Weissella diestrammenae]QNN74749.1 GNAT family N-acetyltransferase [Weissella diestrammenae]